MWPFKRKSNSCKKCTGSNYFQNGNSSPGPISPRDSDASLAEDPKGLSGEAVAARAEGIAQ